MADDHSQNRPENDPWAEYKPEEGASIIEHLREKTEEVDLEQILKKTLGGYTKQSVLDYLGMLRKQQQTMAATFSHNMQTLYEEKEALKKNNEKLQVRINSLESKYSNLSESIHLFEFENKTVSLEDVFALKNNIAVLEGEIKKYQYEINALQNKLEQADNKNKELSNKLETANQEIENHSQIIIAEKIETKKQRDIVSDTANQLEAEIDKNKYLSDLLSSGELAQAKAKVNDLLEQLSTLNQVNARLLSEIQTKDVNIQNQSEQLDSSKQKIHSLSVELEETTEHNDKLYSANQALTEQLLEEYKKGITLVRERSDIMMEKLTLINKLNDATTKISIIEQQIDSDKRIAQIRKLYTTENEIENEFEVEKIMAAAQNNNR